ncbi:MAG: hypothetical protein OEM97_08835 [Acidimicrobiia bacterium]|nr:hypothetical protein [Acidimicrobiia bacterium]
MFPDFIQPPIPDNPSFWDALEHQLRVEATVTVNPAEVPATPEFDGAVLSHLAGRGPVYTEPGFPVIALAAIAAIILAAAGLIQLLPGMATDAQVASPGARARVEPMPEPVSAEPMAVASFIRFTDQRSEADRMVDELRDRGYEVTVTHQTVSDPSLDGEILGVRHADDTSGVTLSTLDARGAVILIVAKAATGLLY